MKYSYVVSALAIASQVLAAPAPQAAIVTKTNVVVVTGAPEASASNPDVVVEVVVSKLVEVNGDSTQTKIQTYTQTVTNTPQPASTQATASVAEVQVQEQQEASSSTTEQVTPTLPVEQVKEKATTTLSPEPVTTSTTEATTEATTAATTTAATATQTAASGFASEILDEHNAKRAEWGSPALSWSDELASYAQSYADQYDCSGSLSHSGGPYGENLALGYTTTGAVDAWYDEKSEYNAQSPTASHFTQVVWKSTTKLGCGVKECNNIWGKYIVCSYDPAGNYAGEYAQNV